MAGLWQQQFVSCCSLNFAVGRSELQKGLWAAANGTKLAGAASLVGLGLGPGEASAGSAAPLARLAQQRGAAVHAGAFSRGLALQGMWCRRNVLLVQPETLGLLQPEKQGGLWQLW